MIQDYPASHWMSSLSEQQSCAESVVRCHPDVRKMLRLHLQGAIAPKRSHVIEITNPGFVGSLDIHLGPGSGHVRIDATGPIKSEIRMLRDSTFSIAERSTINGAIFVIADADVEIGKDNLWSSEILVQANDQHGIVDLKTRSVVNLRRRRIVFCDHVWVGRRVTVLPDLMVNVGSILGAGSVVTKDVPRFCVMAGNPAAVRKSGTTWSRRITGLNDYEQALLAEYEVAP